MKKSIDIIIISASFNSNIIEMTQKCINSCIESSESIDFNIYVVETYDKKTVYENCKMCYFIEKNFNYNKTINYVLKHIKTRSNFVGFFNNDVIFEKDWCENLIKYFDKFDSLSPRCPISQPFFNERNYYSGYEIRKEVSGWAIVTSYDVIEKIGYLNEDVSFWKSDDIYAQQLKKHALKHALITNSIVFHIDNGSNTLNMIENSNKHKLTHGQNVNYINCKDVHNYRFSVIMPSYLGNYINCASDRSNKFVRAVNSFLNQTFKDAELIIVSDGCKLTTDLYLEHFSQFENIKCFEIPKQSKFSGIVRQIGIDYATGELITYLDSDDLFLSNHLEILNKNFDSNALDWIYYNDLKPENPKKYIDIDNITDYKFIVNNVNKLALGVSGTSSITHKRLLNASWFGCDGYTHDFRFIQKLISLSNKYKHFENSGYVICHTVTSGINV